jgi:fibronectin type 3 domain-containing protein
LVTLGTSTSFTNTGLRNGNTYFYKVSAVNAVGEGALSSEISAVPSTASTVPGAFYLTAKATIGGVQLYWTVPSSSLPLLSFDVLRKDSRIERTIAKLSATRTGYVDVAAVSGMNYTYRIVAYNSVDLTTTSSIPVHVVAIAAGQENALSMGQSNQDQTTIWGWGLLMMTIGIVCLAAFFRSRRKQF